MAVWAQLTKRDFISPFLKGQELVNSLDLGGLIVGIAQEAHFKAKSINGMNGFNLYFYSNIETTLSVAPFEYCPWWEQEKPTLDFSFIFCQEKRWKFMNVVDLLFFQRNPLRNFISKVK